MSITEKITNLVEPSLQNIGYSVVQLRLIDGKRKTLSLMAERADGKNMSFDDCAEISHLVSALMEVDDPIADAYNLEICSPGLDRPLVKFADYQRYLNYEIKLETLIPINNRRRFRGVIIQAKDEKVTLNCDFGEEIINFSNIRSGKLIATDEMVRNYLKSESKQESNKNDNQNKNTRKNKNIRKA